MFLCWCKGFNDLPAKLGSKHCPSQTYGIYEIQHPIPCILYKSKERTSLYFQILKQMLCLQQENTTNMQSLALYTLLWLNFYYNHLAVGTLCSLSDYSSDIKTHQNCKEHSINSRLKLHSLLKRSTIQPRWHYYNCHYIAKHLHKCDCAHIF